MILTDFWILLQLVEKEREIYREQSEKSGKPPEIVEKMVEGRLNKFYQESVLMEQSFVKNPDLTIKDLLTEIKLKEFYKSSKKDEAEKKSKQTKTKGKSISSRVGTLATRRRK